MGESIISLLLASTQYMDPALPILKMLMPVANEAEIHSTMTREHEGLHCTLPSLQTVPPQPVQWHFINNYTFLKLLQSQEKT